jgi:hypothetical protein
MRLISWPPSWPKLNAALSRLRTELRWAYSVLGGGFVIVAGLVVHWKF